MRTFSSAVSTAIQNDRFRYFFLIKLEFSQDFYFTSLPYDVTYDGQTWLSDGGVFEVDSPQFSTILDREAYKIIITDLVDSMSAEFKLGVVGSKVEVMVGIIDPSTNQPLLGTNDVIHIYTGFADSPSIENNWDTKTAIIEGSSPMADLDQVNITMVSKDGMDQLSQSDTSYDKIYDDSEIQLKWGKV